MIRHRYTWEVKGERSCGELVVHKLPINLITRPKHTEKQSGAKGIIIALSLAEEI